MTLTDLGPYPNEPGYREAVALDESDPLRHHLGRYVRSDPDLIYLDGNSLGRMPRAAIEAIDTMARDQWGDRLIRSWNEGWWNLQLRLGDKLAPVVGAQPGEVIISDSTSVNLYKLALAAMVDAKDGRNRIVTDDLNFPSDVYILDGVARTTGGELVIVPSDGVDGPVAALDETVDERTALVSLSHTAFKSGYTYDMAAMTARIHQSGAMVLWDCSHSVGALPVDLGAAGADLAVGCTYKYLNGGPGSPAFLYVRTDLQDRLVNPMTGWWGHRAPFAFDLEFEPVSGIRRYHSGTMPILSLGAIEAGLDEVIEAGMPAIRAKSEQLTLFAIDQWRAHLQAVGFTMASPATPERRGAHISLGHEMAWPMTKALIDDAALIPDFRTPDNIRLGMPPLYTSFVDIHTAIQRIRRVSAGGIHLDHVDDRADVT